MGFHEIWIQFERPAIMPDRAFEIAACLENESQPIMGAREIGTQLERPSVARLGLVEPAACPMCLGKVQAKLSVCANVPTGIRHQ
jgi:hypothetical protein